MRYFAGSIFSIEPAKRAKILIFYSVAIAEPVPNQTEEKLREEEW